MHTFNVAVSRFEGGREYGGKEIYEQGQGQSLGLGGDFEYGDMTDSFTTRRHDYDNDNDCLLTALEICVAVAVLLYFVFCFYYCFRSPLHCVVLLCSVSSSSSYHMLSFIT